MEFNLSDREFAMLRQLVYELTGIKLADAKRHMLRSRLTRRLRSLGLTSFTEYHDLVKGQAPDGPEVTEFVNAVTTNKTDFYRESHHFDFFVEQIIPDIEKRTGAGRRDIKIWHAGCSTGEEPYTLAIELHEALANRGLWTVRQLATDIDTNVLQHALKGRYDVERLEPIPGKLQAKYFLRGVGENEGYAQIKPELAEWLTFRRLNLLAEPWPFKSNPNFDVIFCRNVMIYFDKPTQQRLVARFLRVLRPGGYLIIGHSESLFGISDGFASLGKTIYRAFDDEAAA